MTIRTFFATLIFACLPLASQAQIEAPMVVMHTNLGDIKIELFDGNAPKTVENFISYVEDGFYEGIIFHRVIPGFVIQGGGFTEDYERRETKAPIRNESDNQLKNSRGTLSMARTSDPHSASTQFFINLSDNAPLDYRNGEWGYAVFGKVVEGMNVVDKIAMIPTGSGGPFPAEVPSETAVIQSAEVVE